MANIPEYIIDHLGGVPQVKTLNYDKVSYALNGMEVQVTNNAFQSEKWYRGNKLHRDGGPAETLWDPNGEIIIESYYNDGKLHRVDGPAKTFWNSNGEISVEHWYKDDKYHRLNGPAITYWNANGVKTRESWYKDGKLHRVDGPAETIWDGIGEKISEVWQRDGEYHRVDGPAQTLWRSGVKTREIWQRDGKYHRFDGPAITIWDNGSKSERWYINGKEYTHTEFVKENMMRKIKSVRKATKQFKTVDHLLPGTMVWAENSGRFYKNLGQIPFKTIDKCMDSSYIGVDRDGEYVSKYTKDHLYFMAKGMGLPATRQMKKAELCRLLVTGTRLYNQAPW